VPKRPSSSKESEPAAEGKVIALSRYRSQVSRGRRARRGDELFATPHPERAIRTLPPDEFFYVLTELGFPEALEVLQYGTPEQVRVTLDFTLWDRDTLSSEKTDEWLDLLVQAPHQALADWLHGLDVELLALIIRRRARIYDLSLEELPDESEGTFFNTPDGLFTLDLLGDEDQMLQTRRLLETLYRDDQNFTRKLLVGTRAELDTELEDLAYRWRSGRMADLGFTDFYEALEVYSELDPASVKVSEQASPRSRPLSDTDTDAGAESHLRMPGALAERLSGNSPFARAIGAITQPEELAEVHHALVALCNRALSADRVAPGDHETLSAVLGRVAATLDLAVEFLARGSEERAAAAVRSVPMVTIFRLGVSVIGKLRKLGLALGKQTPFARLGVAGHLFESEDAEVIAAVTRLRPLFPRRLESPAAPGERPFASLADVALTTAALERAGAAVALLHGLGVRAEVLAPPALAETGTELAALDHGVLARTALAHRLLGEAPAPFSPLPAARLEPLHQLLDSQDAGQLRRAVHALLAAAAPGGKLTPAMTAVADRWTASLAPLDPVLTTAGLSAPRPT
jgi:hypothetical protein